MRQTSLSGAHSDPLRAPEPSRASAPPPAESSVSDSPELDVLRVPSGFSPERAIDEQIEDLERWALANLRRDRSEKARFWTLRGVAFLGAVGAALSIGFAHTHVAIAASTVTALAIAVDSAWQGGAFKNPHQRAVHDLRELQNTIKLRWDKVRLAHGDPTAPQRIAHALALLDAVQAKREEIGKYLGSSEPSPGLGRRS
ncbi:MAG TPA: hypothetical protein VG937_36760 [Polyangiaceae bacterium]|nr:hypothetical protein [Polyangiaceae bacterium]